MCASCTATFAKETRYAVDPVELAVQYRELGAQWLHVVDLDGAKRGEPVNLDLIRRMRDGRGGRRAGRRRHSDAREPRASARRGDARRDRQSWRSAIPSSSPHGSTSSAPERLALALDVRLDSDGTPLIATHGWTRASTLTLAAAIDRYAAAGLRHVLCTDIDRDGALTGPNTALYRDCVAALAGHRSSRRRAASATSPICTALTAARVAATVSGKALLEGRLKPEEIRPFLRGA